MGIEKPYEVETRRLGPAPGPPVPFDVEARMQELIVPCSTGIRIADRRLELEPDALPASRARELQARLGERLRERRPHAGEHTWAELVAILRGMLQDGETLDERAEAELISAIDGL